MALSIFHICRTLDTTLEGHLFLHTSAVHANFLRVKKCELSYVPFYFPLSQLNEMSWVTRSMLVLGEMLWSCLHLKGLPVELYQQTS